MMTFDQIADEARAYANLTDDQLSAMGTGTLHEQMSLRLVALEEVTASKRALAGSANDLIKRIKGDILCMNQEIRRRHAAEKEGRKGRVELVLEALPEPEALQIVG